MGKEHIVHKTKTLICGHSQIFSTPVPQHGDVVWCFSCNAPSSIPKRPKHRPYTVAEGRRRRLKPNPRANNQHTKGRELSGR